MGTYLGVCGSVENVGGRAGVRAARCRAHSQPPARLGRGQPPGPHFTPAGAQPVLLSNKSPLI